MTLDDAQERFLEQTSARAERAKDYALALIEGHRDGTIGNETLRDGLIEIAQGLTQGMSDTGGAVRVRTIAI
jgi:hypothetical protein